MSAPPPEAVLRIIEGWCPVQGHPRLTHKELHGRPLEWGSCADCVPGLSWRFERSEMGPLLHARYEVYDAANERIHSATHSLAMWSTVWQDAGFTQFQLGYVSGRVIRMVAESWPGEGR